MITSKDTSVLRKDQTRQRKHLTPQDRENIIKPYLPTPRRAKRERAALQTKTSRKPVRDFLAGQLHFLIYTAIHLVFSIYVRVRQTYHILFNRVLAILYYHHRAPELIKQDVKGLTRIPRHLSVILELKGDDRGQTLLESLMDEVAEMSAWSHCVGVPLLSVYEKTGILKHYMPNLHRAVSAKMRAYLGDDAPTVQIGAPNVSSYLNGSSSEGHDGLQSPGHLSIVLISSEDGRSTLVDLTKTLAEMSQRNKLSPNDVSQDLVDAEITESVMGEPDLLIIFGPYVQLQGYPPWQIRLTEIFHVQDNQGLGYQVFLRALHNYSKATMKFGR